MKGSRTEKKEGLRAREREKIWNVSLYPVRRHSRTLYIPLPREVCELHDIQKGDTIKAMLVEVIRTPRADEEH